MVRVSHLVPRERDRNRRVSDSGAANPRCEPSADDQRWRRRLTRDRGISLKTTRARNADPRSSSLAFLAMSSPRRKIRSPELRSPLVSSYMFPVTTRCEGRESIDTRTGLSTVNRSPGSRFLLRFADARRDTGGSDTRAKLGVAENSRETTEIGDRTDEMTLRERSRTDCVVGSHEEKGNGAPAMGGAVGSYPARRLVASPKSLRGSTRAN